MMLKWITLTSVVLRKRPEFDSKSRLLIIDYIDVGDKWMLVTLSCWQFFDVSDRFSILVTSFGCWCPVLMLKDRESSWKNGKNISELSPTHFVSKIRHQHRCSLIIIWLHPWWRSCIRCWWRSGICRIIKAVYVVDNIEIFVTNFNAERATNIDAALFASPSILDFIGWNDHMDGELLMI